MDHPNHPPSHGAGDQMSVWNRDKAMSAHRRWIVAAKVILALFATVLGLQLVRFQTDWRAQAAGVLVGVAGAWGLTARALAAWRHVRALRWQPLGRCVHCGYEISGTPVTTCPECGGDPFAELEPPKD